MEQETTMSPALRLLILEGTLLDAEREIATLEEAGYACQWRHVETRDAFLACLDAPDYDIILVDYNLPAFDGLTALKLFLARDLAIPFILVSDNLGEETAIEGLKAGATDYVLKDHLVRLGPVVERALREQEEHRRAEEAIQLFRFPIEQVPEAVYWMTKEAGFSDVNEQASSMLGYTREELMHLHLFDIDPFYPRERWDMEWAQFEKDGQGTTQAETFHRRKDGVLIPVEVLAKHIWFGGHELHVAFVRDVSERKQADDARLQSEKRFRTVVDQAADAFFLHDINGRILDVNQRACENLGYTREELLTMHVSDVDVEVENSEYKQQFWEKLTTDNPITLEGAHRRRDGTTFPVEVRIGLLDLNGQNHFLALVRDITERKRTEEALRDSEERFRLLSEATFEGIILSEKGKILDANEQLARLYGYDFDEVIGIESKDLVAPESRERIMKYIETDYENPYEAVQLRKDGSRWVAKVAARSVPFKGGKVRVTVIHDINEQKEVVKERDVLINELERKNAELEQKNAELERFTYTVSHDLKSPLVTIKGFLGLLQKDAARGDTERMSRDITQIASAADTMARLLSELLDLSRIGHQMNPPEMVSLTELARETAAMVATPIQAGSVTVVIDPAMPVVFGDRVRLLEVYQNLMENAVKFMGEQAEPRVELGASQEEAEVICHVRDNGKGIASKYHEKIFGLFDRLDQEIEGTGIGLALVKRIVEVHGGRVWVESDGEEHGSTFWFTLPNEPQP